MTGLDYDMVTNNQSHGNYDKMRKMGPQIRNADSALPQEKNWEETHP